MKLNDYLFLGEVTYFLFFPIFYALLEIHLNQVFGFFTLSDSIMYRILYYEVFYIPSLIFTKGRIKYSTVITLFMTVLEDLYYWEFTNQAPISYFGYYVVDGLPINDFLACFLATGLLLIEGDIKITFKKEESY